MYLRKLHAVALISIFSIVALLLLFFYSISGRVFQEPFPDRDIVFQFDNTAKEGLDQIGFINSDGSELVSPEHDWDFYEPQWAGVENNYLLVMHAQGLLGWLNSNTGKLSRVRPAESLEEASSIPGKDEAYIVRGDADHGGTVLHRVSLDTGDFLQTFPSEDDWLIDIGANTQAGSLVVYSRTRFDNSNWPQETELIISGTETMSGRALLQYTIEDPVADASILNPAIALDGQWIAYTHTDGIHLIRPDGSGDKLLVNIPDWNAYWPVYTWAPKASWSPDSKWIVYHRCLNESCTLPERTGRTIHKMNIETGENVLLFHGGVNPYWKLVD